MADPPLPPESMMVRVGSPPDGRDPGEYFVEVGRRARARIDELAPSGWTWEGRRVLDFGCGAARTLRHFLPEAERGEFWGCDIHEPSVRWIEENLSPPLNAFTVGERPGLPQPDGHFDAIWGLSVFSHIDEGWAEWLLELRRVLADDGWLLLTFLSDGFADTWAELAGGEPWDPERVGRAVFAPRARWDEGGPSVFLSEWWVRARWSRAFSIEALQPTGFRKGNGSPQGAAGQGYVVLRKRPGTVTADDLRRPEAGEPREAIAALAEVDRLRAELDRLQRSRSWRVTEPLRRGIGLTRRPRR